MVAGQGVLGTELMFGIFLTSELPNPSLLRSTGVKVVLTAMPLGTLLRQPHVDLRIMDLELSSCADADLWAGTVMRLYERGVRVCCVLPDPESLAAWIIGKVLHVRDLGELLDIMSANFGETLACPERLSTWLSASSST
jgi:hypothetical protein